MRIFSFFLICLYFISFSNSLFGQKNYPSLLWKIEGNGLKKASYLYGTMHVSSKIAFNLGDEFFEALASTDAVALETNPENWLTFYRESGLTEASQAVLGNQSRYTSGKGFYKKFLVVPEYDLELFQTFLAPQERLLNQLLYRYNFGQENYEETTYLDMFIFQSAKKNQKPIYSLEDMQESFILAEYSNLPDDDEEKKDYYNNYDQGNNLEKYYLERDLDALDSLISKDFSKNYRKYLLSIRNENMVIAMDSIMPKQSIFAGVGAAHLAGDEGMIEMLRAKGYTVTPVEFHRSNKASKTFRKLLDANTELPTQKHISKDQRISFNAVGKFYDENENQASNLIQSFFCPDFANGSYYGYERLKRVPFGKNFSSKSDLRYIDSVLYLITPGELSDKKELNVGKYKAIEVTSKLQRNSYYKALIVETPQEIIVFKTGGNKSFITSKNVKNYFSSVVIQDSDPCTTLKNLGVEVNFPGSTVVHGNIPGSLHVTSVDKNNAYYTLEMRYLMDFMELEEDEFELNYLVNALAEELEGEVVNKQLNNKSITATIEFGKNTLHVHYLIYNNFYFRLLSTAEKDQVQDFFNSFKRIQPNYEKKAFEKKSDTMINYSVTTFAEDELNEELVSVFEGLKNEFLHVQSIKDSLKPDFESTNTKKIYEDIVTGEAIELAYYKPNTYYSYKEGIQTIKDFASIENTSDSLNYTLHYDEIDTTEHGAVLNYYYTKKGTTRILKLKYILTQNRIFTLTANIDTTVQQSKFMETFFNSFEPILITDTVVYNLLDHKGERWLKDIFSDKYQLYTQAKESVDEIIFEKKDLPQLSAILMNDTLKNIDDELRGELLEKYIELANEETNFYPFIEDFIKKYENNNALKIKALAEISQLANKKSTEKFIEFLTEQPPIIHGNGDLNYLFGIFSDSTHLMASHESTLAEFGLEFEEYFPRIIYLFDRGIYKGGIDRSSIPADFIAEAHKTGTKHLRKLAYYSKESKSKYNETRSELLEIASLIYSIPNSEAKYNSFFKQLDTITDKRFRSNILAKQINRNNPYTKAELIKVMEDTNFVYPFFDWISGSGVTDSLFNIAGVTKELLYQSYIMQNGDYNADEDTLTFLRKEKVATFGKSGYAYIFKATNEDNRKRLRAVYFVNDEDGKVCLYPLKLKTLKLTDEDDLEEKIEELLKDISYSNRTRVGTNYYDYYY